MEDIIIGIVAIIISMLSIIYTWKGFEMQREHNYKSLQPIGKLRSFDYENNISVRIDNYGTGPLIITKFLVNDQEVDEEAGLIDFIPKEFSKSLVWKNFTGNYIGRAISSNDNLELIAWSTVNYNSDDTHKMNSDRTKLRQILKDLNLKVEYQGIYRNETFTDQMDLKWYGRNLENNSMTSKP